MFDLKRRDNLPIKINLTLQKKEDHPCLILTPTELKSSLTAVAKNRTGMQLDKNVGRLEVVMAFDTTSSMYSYFEKVRENLQQMAEKICQKTKAVRFCVIPYKNHDDVGYFDGQFAFLKSQLTTNIEEIRHQIMMVPKGGGGPDWLTVLEDVFHYLNTEIQWGVATKKILIIVGDEPPHGVKDNKEACPFGYDYEKEIATLIKNSVRIYPVLCGSDEATASAFKVFADQSKGIFLKLEQIDDLVDLITGICFKEVNLQLLRDFQLDLNKKGQLPPSKKQLLLLLGHQPK